MINSLLLPSPAPGTSLALQALGRGICGKRSCHGVGGRANRKSDHVKTAYFEGKSIEFVVDCSGLVGKE